MTATQAELLALIVLPAIALVAGWLLGRRRAHALEIELTQARAISSTARQT